MAYTNANNPFGFRPLIRVGGVPFSLTEYAKPATDANAIYMYDVVKKVVGAVPMPENSNYNLPTVQTGYQGTPGTTLWQGVSINYGALSTLSVHMVSDEPDVIYMAQDDASTPQALFSTANTFQSNPGAGKNANISTLVAGSTTTKQSGLQVSNTSIATTNTLDLRILKVSTISPNLEGSPYAILEVVINKHEFGQQTAGV